MISIFFMQILLFLHPFTLQLKLLVNRRAFLECSTSELLQYDFIHLFILFISTSLVYFPLKNTLVQHSKSHLMKSSELEGTTLEAKGGETRGLVWSGDAGVRGNYRFREEEALFYFNIHKLFWNIITKVFIYTRSWLEQGQSCSLTKRNTINRKIITKLGNKKGHLKKPTQNNPWNLKSFKGSQILRNYRPSILIFSHMFFF